MTTTDSSNIRIRIIQAIFAFASSYIFLLFIFLSTMLNHNEGYVDWPYLIYVIPRIAIISIVPVVVVIISKISKLYLSVPCGAIVGLFVAVVYVYIIIN
jgi:hypothetical protein